MKDKKEYLNKIKGKVVPNKELRNVAKHHIESFNYAMEVVLKKLPKYIRAMEYKTNEKQKKLFKSMIISYEEFELG